jgi:hypothetical protein
VTWALFLVILKRSLSYCIITSMGKVHTAACVPSIVLLTSSTAECGGHTPRTTHHVIREYLLLAITACPVVLLLGASFLDLLAFLILLWSMTILFCQSVVSGLVAHKLIHPKCLAPTLCMHLCFGCLLSLNKSHKEYSFQADYWNRYLARYCRHDD